MPAVKTTPKAIFDLESRVGRVKAAGLLGVHTTAYTGWHKEGAQAVLAYELAARYHLSKLDRNASAPKVLIARIPAAKLEVVETFLNALEVKHKCI